MRTLYLVGLICVLSVVGQLVPLVELPVGTTTGSLLPTTEELADYPSMFYKLYVPENTSALSLTFAQTDSVCTGDIRYFIHASHIPCGTEWSEDSDVTYPCRYGVSDYFTDSSSDLVTLIPDGYANDVMLKPGSWVYISMSRDVPSSDYAGLCTYSILVAAEYCPVGQVGVDAGSSTPACVTPTTVTVPHMATLPDTDVEANYRVAIPAGTAYIHLSNYNGSYSTYVHGNPLYYGGDYNYECYDSASYDSVLDIYTLDTYCYNPPEGWFYFYLYTYSSGYQLSGMLTIDIVTCPQDRAGYNCTYMAYNITNQVLSAATYGIDAGEGAGSISPYNDAFKMFYINAPVGYTGAANFTTTLTVGASSWQYYRRNGYIADTSANYLFLNSLTLNTAETIALTPLDFNVGGTFHFGISNEGSAAVNFTLSTSSAGPAGTSDASSTDASSTTDTGAASAIVACFQLVLALAVVLIVA